MSNSNIKMAINNDKDFTITNYLRIQAGERDTKVDGVFPFILGLRNNPVALRDIVEALILAVNWSVTAVGSGGESSPYSMTSDDVVILADAGTTINLPAATTGRVVVIKDRQGTAGSNAITINRNSANTIDGSNTSFSLNANYGAVILVAASGASNAKWHTIALV